jgi:hypothetical protein
MARCKNIGGGPGDEDRHPPCLTDQQKVKGKVTTKKKRKRDDIEAERATIVAATTEHAERGGRGSGIQIGEARFQLEGQELGIEGTEQTEIEEQAEQTEQTEQVEQTEPPYLRRSTRTCTQVSPRPET